MSGHSENISPNVIQHLNVQIQDLMKNPINGISFEVNETEICDIQACITGPDDTPYSGGLFKIKLVIHNEYPRLPPKGCFLTKIFHPNISQQGEICVNTLKKDWTSDTSLKQILLVIKCLLIDPNPESALNEEAGKLLLEDYSLFFKKAKLCTEIHALKKADNNLTNTNISTRTGLRRL